MKGIRPKTRRVHIKERPDPVPHVAGVCRCKECGSKECKWSYDIMTCCGCEEVYKKNARCEWK